MNKKYKLRITYGSDLTTEVEMTDDVIGFAYGYATRIIEEMDPKENWEDYDTWCAHGKWDINFHVSRGHLCADAYRWTDKDGTLTDGHIRIFDEYIK
jgi:hypothetical protein